MLSDSRVGKGKLERKISTKVEVRKKKFPQLKWKPIIHIKFISKILSKWNDK